MEEEDSLNKDLNKVKELSRQAIETFNSLDEYTKETLAICKDISLKKTKYSKDLGVLKRFSTSADTTLVNAAKKRDELQSLIKKMNLFYTRTFTPLQKKVDDPVSGLKAKLKDATVLNRGLSQQKKDAEKYTLSLKESLKEFSVRLIEVKRISKSASAIYTTISKNEKISTELLTEIRTLNIEAATKLNVINNLHDEASTLEGKIRELEDESTSNSASVLVSKEKSEEYLKDIQGIYEIATDTGLAGSFDQRRKKLQIEVSNWGKQLVFTTILLLSVIVGLYLYQIYLLESNKLPIVFDVNFYLRFLMTSPVVFYLFFITNQYNKTKSLVRKYSFKTTLASSIKGHMELMMRSEVLMKHKGDEVSEFIIDAFKKMYKEPYDDSTSSNKAKIEINYDKLKVEVDYLKKIIEMVKS